jgi:hypothetical protein
MAAAGCPGKVQNYVSHDNSYTAGALIHLDKPCLSTAVEDFYCTRHGNGLLPGP